MIKLWISTEAQNDLLEIKKYITGELGNPTAAANILTRITKKLRTLTEYPEIGSPLSSVVEMATDYRFLVCGNYMAFYRYDTETVHVIRVLYGRRDYMKILFGGMVADETDSAE